MTFIKDEALEALARIGDGQVDLVLTDPPYDLDYETRLRLHQEFLRVCKGDVIVFSPVENEWRFDRNETRDTGTLTDVLFWVKPTSTKNYSRHYGRFVEMIFCYRRDLASWNRNLHWSDYTSVYHDLVLGVSGHPYEKPYSLLERLALLHSGLDQVILDPFCGSGMTLIAAERNGRRAIGIDRNDSYLLPEASK